MKSTVRKLKPALKRGQVKLWCSDAFKKSNPVLHCILRKLVGNGKWRWHAVSPTVALVVNGEADEVSKTVSSKCAVLTAKEFTSSKRFWQVDHAKSLHGMCRQ